MIKKNVVVDLNQNRIAEQIFQHQDLKRLVMAGLLQSVILCTVAPFNGDCYFSEGEKEHGILSFFRMIGRRSTRSSRFLQSQS
jgi:hypothetical protein